MKTTSNAANQRLWLLLGGWAICLVAWAKTHFLLTLVVGASMQPTFNTGDLLIVDKRAYQETAPRRNDMVVARYRNELIVKRVIGLPGEEVEVSQGTLYLNGTPFEEPYPVEQGPLRIGKGRLSANRFALLGDNRSLPPAQLIHAIVPEELIVGKVVFAIRLPWRHRYPGGETPS